MLPPGPNYRACSGLIEEMDFFALNIILLYFFEISLTMRFMVS